ncbi:MAG: hypothetical protein HYV90_03685 [Candidatus Woesebacteria bacterium]|nr:MAG: hypothetical protein HYV90_03685 [Candidatus Woesebacteria bacterium]
MSEIHHRRIRDIFDPKNLEISISSHAKTVKIENSKGLSLLGVLVDKSIAIPLSAPNETDDALKAMVKTNLMSNDFDPDSCIAKAACNLMELPFNGNTGGFYSDGSFISFINVVHIHPENLFASQEEFFAQLKTVFEDKGLKITLNE